MDTGYAGAVDPNVPGGGTATAPGGDKPSFWQRALPTVGAVGGGILGELVDPFGGGIAGAALGAALAGGGAAAGKVAENKMTGQAGGNGVLGAATGGAIGQGIGAGAGALLGKVAGMAGNAASKGAGEFLQGQAVRGSLGKNDATTLANLGVNDLRNIPGLADHITGEGGALNQGVNKALIKNGSPVDVSGIMSLRSNAGMGLGAPGGLAQELVANETAIGDSAGNKIIGQANKSVANMLGGNAGSIGNQMADPLDVLQQSRVFDTLAARARTSAVPEQQAVARVYNQLGRELEDRAFNPGGQSVPLSDDVKSQIIDQLGSLKDSSPKVYGQLVSDVTNADNAQDLRGLQALWVRGSQAAQKTATAIDRGSGTSSGDIVKGTSPGALLLAGHPLTALGTAATSLPAADRAAAGVLPKVAAGLNKLGPKSTPVRTASLLQRIGGALGATAGTAANLPGGPENQMQSDQGALMPTANTTAPGASPNIFGALANPNSPGAANYAPIGLQAMLGMFDPSLLSGTVETNALTGEQNIQKAQAGASLLPGLETLFQNAGGAQGPILGGLERLIPGSTASRYGGQAQQVLNQIASASGLPANELVAPQVTQNPTVANSALSQIAQLLAAQGAMPSAVPAQ